MFDEEKKQPGFDAQELLMDIRTAEPTEIEWRGKKIKIGWMRHASQEKFSKVMLKDKSDNVWRRNVKLCAITLLNGKSGFWTMIKQTFFYPFYWRWLYYVLQIDQTDVAEVLDAAKKKIQLAPSLTATILATGMMDTMMTMNSQEVRLIQAERSGEANGV